ncbi:MULTISPECIES: Rossmann-like domain-containing protein [Calditerrivibrio]|jgi:uncharacterized protein (DUF4213/DUF364 family)|uniref:Rossmann-like domain-containing protein n=1 Tax=Calditerrivibrio TaxID=545865 RepID=UPI003C7817C8
MNLLIKDIFEEASDKLKDLTILDYVIGLGYTLVETEAGAGVAYTFRNSIPGGCNATDNFFIGKNALEVAKWVFSNGLLESAIGLATINSVLDNGYPSYEDISEIIDFNGKTVSMVGYFKPVENQIKPIVKELYVFELKNYPDTFNPGYAKLIIPKSDIVIISGTTFINKTTEDFLSFVDDYKKVIFLGASTPLSISLSKYGTIAGSKVIDVNYTKSALSKGGGMKLMKKGLERRIIIAN